MFFSVVYGYRKMGFSPFNKHSNMPLVDKSVGRNKKLNMDTFPGTWHYLFSMLHPHLFFNRG